MAAAPLSVPRSLHRGLALACVAFLVWRAGAAAVACWREWTIPLGTHRQALQWSEAERIDATFARLDAGAGLPDGYLRALHAALLRLPPETRIWTALEPRDPRFRITIWLTPLVYPRRIGRVTPGGKPRSVEGNAILAFDTAPLPDAERFERVAGGPDWGLWR